ncbi:hypothetical protein BAUCODRAFT_210817 [Baudoinia panamericana UAMH 10762]|uniref:Uncharacterized protein n=1 Tax=Baudoinia panamericana (strain UAMH 10762) TaxID=717646 RepID=M2MQM4_BAUPA|nr:uncharacterized protein BAUCODRAFT_210817 [Baudoinia panamericana UAMH 10762]EMC93793.1 hypothetical protein BAUCODRAFT_210817 [Baudoinia panamericana UAMH 10762]
MASNNMFVFGAGGGQQVPVIPGQHAPQNALPPVKSVQQALSQDTAQPIAMSGNLADALKGIPPEQLFQIISMVQSGALQLPSLPSNAQPGAPAQVTMPAPPLVQPSSNHGAPAARIQDVDMDREEGELEDGEEAGPVRERDFLRPPPTGPRIRSVSPSGGSTRQQPNGTRVVRQPPQSRPDQVRSNGVQPEGVANGIAHVSSNKITTNARGKVVDARARARAFVLQMHNAGYTFDQLANEIPNKNALRRMYKSLGLPLPAEGGDKKDLGPVSAVLQPTQPQKSTPHAPSAPHPIMQIHSQVTQPPSVLGEPRPAELPIKKAPAPKPTASSREEYLARLAAVKSKAKNVNPKSTLEATASESSGAAPAPAPAPTPILEVSHAAAKPTFTAQSAQIPIADASSTASTFPAQPLTPSVATAPTKPPPAAGKIQTELIKQRLAALKASQAAKAHAAKRSSDVAPSSSPAPMASATISMSQPPAQHAVTGGVGSGIADLASSKPAPATNQIQPPQVQSMQAPPLPLPTAAPPASPPASRLFSLPGLFVASPPVQQLARPAQPFSPLPPVTSTTAKTYADKTASSPTTLNLNRKRAVAADFDGDVMVDSAPSAPKRPAFGQSRSNSESERLVIEVSDNEDGDDDMEIDTEPASTTTIAPQIVMRTPEGPSLFGSFTIAPGRGTPSTLNEADRRKMINELNRQIAEKEAKRKAKIAAQASSTSVSGQTTPTTKRATPTTLPNAVNGLLVPAVEHSRTVPTAAAQILSPVAVARQQERAQLEQRLKQLQEEAARRNGVASVIQPSVIPAAALPETPAAPVVELKDVQQNAGIPNAGEGKESADEADIDDETADLYSEDDQKGADVDVRVDDGTIGSPAVTMSEPGNISNAAVTLSGQAQSLATTNGERPNADPPTAAVADLAKTVTSDDTDMALTDVEEQNEAVDEAADNDEVSDRSAGDGVFIIKDRLTHDTLGQAEDTSDASSTNTDDAMSESDEEEIKTSARIHPNGNAHQKDRMDHDAISESLEVDIDGTLPAASAKGNHQQEEDEADESEEFYEPTVPDHAVSDADGDATTRVSEAIAEGGSLYEPVATEQATMKDFSHDVTQSLMLPGISDVQAISPPVGTAGVMEVADDVAPELQQPRAEQTAVEDDQVREDSDWSDIY